MENINNQGFSFDLPKGNSSIIKVIGVGGGGNNALKHMYEKGIHGVDFVICNTDSQTLDNNPVSNKIQLGMSTTEGLGAGADPDVGEKAAIESIEEIKAAMGQNTKMVFITAGMGGGTGTGAAPVIAKVAKDMGILTVGIVTVPFSFEGKRRLDQADLGLEKLRNNVDSLIVINNDKLRQQFGNLGFKSGFAKADEVLTNAAKAMAEVITGHFTINIDFRDAKSVLENSGTALMSTGSASGENKAEEAVKKALDSPLLNDNKITGAKNVLLLIRSGNEEATMDEIGIINDYIQKEAGNTADIIFGVGADEELGDAVSVLVIATGFAKDYQKHSGTTEKIKFALSDHIETTRETSSPKTEEEKPKDDFSGKSLFVLDDEEDFNTPEFKVQTAEKKAVIEKEVPAEIKFFNTQEPEEEPQEIGLFSLDSNMPEEPEALSFTFESEEKTEDTPKEEPISFLEEKPIEYSFFEKETPETETLNETEIPQQKAELSEETAQKINAEIQQETEIEETPKFEVENDFTFINKTSSDGDKIMERRNKLKEFNSRYQNLEEENDFETIPAFRRKNISINEQNPSEQNIGSFLFETDGKMQLKENKFLNKDVD